MPRVFLFCNDRYGAPFAATATQWARLFDQPLTVVVSVPSPSSHRTLFRCLKRTRRELLARFKRSSELLWWNVFATTDVNSTSFISNVSGEDLGVIAGFNQIFQAGAISAFERLVNFHPSLLPYYRGPVPSHWAIENEERETGYTLHEVTERIDDGRILYQQRIPISPTDTAATVDQSLAHAAQGPFCAFLEHWRRGTEWKPRILDASHVYHTLVDYRSFP